MGPMSIQAYTGPTASSSHGAIVLTRQELTPEEYERRQKEVCPGPKNSWCVALTPT